MLDPATSRCFVAFDTPLTWTNAKNACAALSGGGALAVPTNASTNAALRKATPYDAWLGATDAVTETTWLDTFSMPVTYTSSWYTGRPLTTATNSNDCARFYAWAGLANADRWYDDTCTQSKPYVCEVELGLTWPDGTLAKTCRDYRYSPPAGFTAYTTDGVYWIDPDGASSTYQPFKARCDMTRDGGGWTRVSTIFLDTSCYLYDALAHGDPRVGGSCTKYSDALINAIAQNKVFVSRVPDPAAPTTLLPSTFTRYLGSIAYDGNPTAVIQGTSYTAVMSTSAWQYTLYGAGRLFQQMQWYTGDSCAGVPAEYARLSLEYLQDIDPWPDRKYAVYGSCGDGGTEVENVQAEVYIR
ncbi:MAG: hypothetical protein EP329_19945 [Deltaproteobacteria bacterium]|nr:MAG: hypothetical protein EP329_19945 [Deltaproteobacteria bacterium]